MCASDLQVEAAYFHKACEAWHGISDTLKQSRDHAAGTAKIPYLWGKTGSFNGVVDKINNLAATITDDLLDKGSKATASISQKLLDVGKMYVVNEASGEDEAADLQRILDGTE